MNTPLPRIPTLRSVDHVAYTVPDLGQAIDFFVNHFGAEVIFHDGPFSDSESDTMYRRLRVDPRSISRLAMIRIGLHTNIELFQYEAPDQSTQLPKNSDVGGHHLAFYVDDIDAAHAYIQAVPGVEVMEGVNGVADNSPVAGQRWFYFRAPWGMQMEFTTDSRDGFYRSLPGQKMAPPPSQWR